MKGLIPGLGEKKTRDRLDELFNRQTLGSVIFGGHLNKLFEKLYNIMALTTVLYVLGVDLMKSLAVAFGLFFIWLIGLLCVVYAFVKWEQITQAAEEAAEKAKDATDDV